MGALAGLFSFFTGPIGKYALIGLAFLAWTLYQRDQAADKARETCQAEHYQQTIEELRRQRDAAQLALKRAAEQAAATRQELLELKEEYDAIRESLSDDEAAAPCVIPDAVLERLRRIR